MEDAGGNEPQDKFSVADADSMACVVAALIASDDVEVRRKYVDYFALAFVAPLRANYDNVFHVNPLARGVSDKLQFVDIAGCYDKLKFVEHRRQRVRLLSSV